MALSENQISHKDLQVLQSIQDVCHNCANLKVAQDDLLKTTTCAAHELDNKKTLKDDEPTISFDQIADMLQQRDDHGVREVHPSKRSLSIITSRCNIKKQSIPDCWASIPNIIDIPQGIRMSCGIPLLGRRAETKI